MIPTMRVCDLLGTILYICVKYHVRMQQFPFSNIRLMYFFNVFLSRNLFVRFLFISFAYPYAHAFAFLQSTHV